MVTLLPILLASQLVPIRGELRAYRSEQVYSGETGFVERVRVDAGDRVAEGDVLADVFRDIGEDPYRVRAPFSGVIVACYAGTGARVGPGARRHASPMFEIAEIRRLIAVAVVPNDLPAGTAVAIGTGQRKTAGVLERTVTRAGLRYAEIAVDNAKGEMKPGGPVEVFWPGGPEADSPPRPATEK